MRRILLLLVFASFFVSMLEAQPIRKSTYDNMIKAAEQSLANQDYYNALDWYEQAYEEREDKTLLPTIADMHFQLRDYRKAERWYGQLIRRDKENQYAEYRYTYGRVLKMNEKYPEAIEVLQQFANETKSDSLRKLALSEVTGAEMAMEMPEVAKGVSLENAGKNVNNKLSEYSPVYSPDGSLYFVGFDGDDVFYVDENSKDNFYAHIQRSTMGKKGWDKPTTLDNKINRPGVHKTHISFSGDGRYMFYTQGTLGGHMLDNTRIYFSTGDGGNWQAGQEIKGINGQYVNKHPVPGELFGNEVLFFASNMPGGYGGYDLYYATKVEEGVYEAPVNLGEKINTLGDDETPFYWDGTLYFSSTGHPTIGGFDIFFTTWDGSSWSDPENMGKIYNSSADDQYFSLGDDGYKGFLVSNRPGDGARSAKSRTCCNDIYGFSIARLYADLVVGVFNAETRKPIMNGEANLIELQEMAVDAKKNEDSNRFDFGLGLEKPYKIVVNAKGFYPDSMEFNTVGLTESQTFSKNFLLKPLPPPEPEFDTINIEEPIVLENILYDFDDDRITKSSEQDLQIVLDLMNQYPNMVIELGSHTDIRGVDSYNENLSQRRANSARRWLINRGVDGERIKAKGYGETQPQTVRTSVGNRYDYLKEGDLLTEEYINALSSEDQQEVAHQLNRRTEFKIIEGPTSITIKRIKKVEPKTNDAPKGKNALPQSVKGDPVKISMLSSLYGRKDLKGVPIMHFEERMVDFGVLKRGEKREYEYEFVNKGDTNLQIAVVTACECTETEYSSTKVYKPGEKGTIKIVFDSTEKEESETVDVDIMLDNVEPDTGNPIMETVQFKFELKQ